MDTRKRTLLLALALVSLSAAATRRGASAQGSSHEASGPWIRVNQVGYLANDPKIALLSSDRPLEGKFTVGEFSASIGADQGAWGPFAHNYRLDFSTLKTPGR